jgi:hypothetical protein
MSCSADDDNIEPKECDRVLEIVVTVVSYACRNV